MEVTRGEAWSWTQSSKSANYALQERALFIGSFFLNLPLPSRGNPYVAVCDVPSLQQTVVVRRQFDEIFSWCWPPTGDLGVQCRTDLDSQYLDPWSEKEEERFCRESTRTDGSAQHPNFPVLPAQAACPPTAAIASSEVHLYSDIRVVCGNCSSTFPRIPLIDCPRILHLYGK